MNVRSNSLPVNDFTKMDNHENISIASDADENLKASKMCPTRISTKIASEFLFRIASVCGFHVFSPSEKCDEYVVSKGKNVLLIVYLVLGIVTLMGQIALCAVQQWSLFFTMFMIPFEMSLVYQVCTYILMLKNKSLMVAYLNEIKDRPVSKGIWYLVYPSITLCYAVGYCLTFLISMPISLMPYFVMLAIFGVIPAIMDIYMIGFTAIYNHGFTALKHEVRGKKVWNLANVLSISKRWIELNVSLDSYNQIFNILYNLRTLLFILQMMSYLYLLTSFPVPCFAFYFLAGLATAEIFIRLFSLCHAGQKLTVIHGCLVQAALELSFNENLQGNVQEKLNCLLSRMEAHPAVVQIWGLDGLTGKTFIFVVGMVSTYLVVLIQFNPFGEANFNTTDLIQDSLLYKLCAEGASN